MRLKRRIIALSAALAAIVAVGTFGFVIIDGRPVFEGFYFTITTLTTIGYGELWKMSRAARMFNSGLIVVGVVLLFALLGTLTEALIEAELKGAGRRRMEKRLGRLENHYIVCGVGRVGSSVVRELESRGAPHVIIEKDPERVRWAVERDALLVVGDASKEATLRQARIEASRGLVAALGDDAQNIYVTLAARALNPSLQIVARASDAEAEHALRRAGADLVVSPYSYSGLRIAQALLQPHVLDFLDTVTGSFASGVQLMIEEIRVRPGSPLAGQTLEQSGIRQKLGIMILAMKKPDGKMGFNPPFDASPAAGDYLIAMGEKEKLKSLEQLASAPAT
jgi:voltage-gated potassium channel